jgi:hypothetical protein
MLNLCYYSPNKNIDLSLRKNSWQLPKLDMFAYILYDSLRI